MALLVPNQGEDLALQALVNKTAPQNLTYRLYKNNKTPAETDTEADYTQSTFTGYAAAALTGASWSTTPGAPTSATYAQQSFTSSADQAAELAYGYYVIQATSGKLVWAERFTNGPYTIANNGDVIKITPTITAD